MTQQKYTVKQHVDYITFTSSEFKPIDDILQTPEPCRPLIANYSTAQIYKCGMIVQWHDDNPSLKKHITLTGTTLDNLRVMGFTDSEITEWLQSLDRPNFKRIDLAITSSRNDGGIHCFLPHFAHWITRAGWCETRLELDKPVTDIDLNVETAYIGNRKKREYMRIYDKGIDLGLEANKIIRFELERHSVANTIARDVIQKNNYAGVIRRYVDFPQSPEWLEIMDCEPIPRTNADIAGEKGLDRELEKLWQWLHNSVAPAYARALYMDKFEPDKNPNVDEFARLITQHYNKLVNDNL